MTNLDSKSEMELLVACYMTKLVWLFENLFPFLIKKNDSDFENILELDKIDLTILVVDTDNRNIVLVTCTSIYCQPKRECGIFRR